MRLFVAPAACLVLLFSCGAPSPGGFLNSQSPAQVLERMIEISTPGPEHAALEEIVGTFDAEVAAWAGPYDEPMRSQGRMINRWALGGRYVIGEFRGYFRGQPFEGLSILGFDRSRNVYISTWGDTASTWFLPFSTGTRTGDTITLFETA